VQALKHSFPNKGCLKLKVKHVPDSYPKTEKYFAYTTSQHPSPNNKLKTANDFKASFMCFVKQCK